MPYEPCDKRPAQVSSTAGELSQNDYSTPAAYGFRDVLVKGLVDEVGEDFSAILLHNGLNMMAYEKIDEISVAKILRDFIADEVLPGTGIGAGQFWSGLAGLIGAFAPRIRDQLRFRDELQERIDEYHRATATRPFDPAAYGTFLRLIGYLVPEPPNFTVRTENVLEIARVAGPQLVVPASNARHALNAANARWGSLYDALYGTDAIPETNGAARGKGYNKVGNIGKLTTLIAKMPAEDRRMVMETCFSCVSRKGTGGVGWQPIWNSQAGRLQYDDLNSLPAAMAICGNVISDKRKSFFPASPPA